MRIICNFDFNLVWYEDQLYEYILAIPNIAYMTT